MKVAFATQFLGMIPPIRVFANIANRLWGFEGEIVVSQLSVGFFLVEFPSVRLCDWVMERAWHIHQSPLLLRKWYHGIEPVTVEKEVKSVWVTLGNVPPPLIYTGGIRWITSQIGKPRSKFVREGLSVKLCLMRKDSDSDPSELVMFMGELGSIVISVEYSTCRTYHSEKQRGKI
ncbi:hypothetical protein LINPERPRIM_LOCUS238 [Linum perenne]